jgi:hypothetical protein
VNIRGLCRRALAAVLVVTALSGCSAIQFAYNNVQTAARFMVSDYVDFDSAQVDEFKARFTQFHEWHRGNELPVYAALLTEAGGRIQRGLTEADVRWAITSTRDRYHLVAARAIEEAVPMLLAMTPAQIQQIEKGIAEKNAKFERENINADPRKVLKRRIGQMQDNFSEWLGHLTDAQEALIRDFVTAHSDLTALRYADRRRWQREAVAVLRTHAGNKGDGEQLTAALTDLIARPEKGRQPAIRQALAHYDDELVALVIAIERTLSAEQRARAVKRMQVYADDFTALSKRKSAGTPS